jgi:hypothetical protein
MITELVERIADLTGVRFDPVAFKPRLEDVITELPRVPNDLQEYLEDCLLNESYGDPIEFHGTNDCWRRNEALVLEPMS